MHSLLSLHATEAMIYCQILTKKVMCVTKDFEHT